MTDRRRETTHYLLGLVILSCLWVDLHTRCGPRTDVQFGGGFSVERDNYRRSASLEYQVRLRETLLVQVGLGVGAAGDFVSGARKCSPEDWRLRAPQVLKGLRAALAEVNCCQVPPRFAHGHSQLVIALRHAYEGVKLAERARETEEARRRKKLFDRAESQLRQARQANQAAAAELKRQLDLTWTDR